MGKPSKQTTIRAKRNRFLCLPSFKGIMLFGTLFTRTKELADSVNNQKTIETNFLCHEMIHVKQAANTKDSWLLYYIIYIWQWLCNLPLVVKGILMPYRFIALELEAYLNEDDFTYPLSQQGGCTQWRKLNKLRLKDKMRLADSFKKQHNISFSRFIKRALDVDTL